MLDSIGCTANVVFIDSMKKIYAANAGDSRAVLARAGKAVPLSFDHKPDDEGELKRIEKAGSVVTEGRVDGNLNLSRALGDLKYKTNKDLKPEKVGEGSLAFMFETAYIMKIPKFAIEKSKLDTGYVGCWGGLQNHFRSFKI